MVSLEWIWVWISLVFIFIVQIFEGVRIWFALFYFESRWIHLEVCLITSGKVMIMLNLMRSITFDIARFLSLIHEGSVSPLLTVLILEDIRIHIYSLNYCDMTSYIKALVDQRFSGSTTLQVLYINPNNRHVWFEKNFDYMQFWSNVNIVKNISGLDDWFHCTWIDRHVCTLNDV